MLSSALNLRQTDLNLFQDMMMKLNAIAEPYNLLSCLVQ